MMRTTLRALAVVALAGLVQMPALGADDAPGVTGLRQVPSRYLDEVLLRPDARIESYRAVLVEPAQVRMHEAWQKDMNYHRRASSRRIGEDVAKGFTEDAAASVRTAIAEAFRKRGYEIARDPGPGVLRLSPRIPDLYINAPEALATATTRVFAREAGDATLILEARDSQSGQLLARIVHRDEAGATRGFSRTSDVANRFWFDGLFDRWAAHCASEMAALRKDTARPLRQ